jgi:hypothetical protein
VPLTDLQVISADESIDFRAPPELPLSMVQDIG